MEAFKSTMMHVLELAVILGLTYAAQRLFGLSSEAVMGVVILALAGLAKLARAHDSVPVGDYVNE